MSECWYSPSLQMVPGREFLLQCPGLSNVCLVLALPHLAMSLTTLTHTNIHPLGSMDTQSDTTLHADIILVFWQEIQHCVAKCSSLVAYCHVASIK